MKNFLYFLIIVAAGFLLAFGLSTLLIGFDRTSASLATLSRRVLPFKEQPVRIVSQNKLEKGESVLGVADANYNNIEISDVQVIKFEKEPAPFIVPTNGIAGHGDFLYLPEIHPGIDIWNSTNGKGNNGTAKGDPIYSACTGTVTRIFIPNQEIEVVCDELSEKYAGEVPSLKVKALYAHLGDGATKQQFHSLRVGQRLKQGELIGYQGNISESAPWNTVTHLHFGVYDMSKGGTPPPLDPEDYIGVPTKVVGQQFVATVE